MVLSFTSILTTIFYSSVLIIFISFFLNRNMLIKQVGISSLLLCIAVIIVRLLIPFELPFAMNLPFSHILPEIVLFFKTTVITIGDYNINFYHISILLWVSGTLISILKTIYSNQHFKKSIGNFANVSDVQIQNALQTVLEKYNKPKEFKIVQTSAISTPMILGLWKPKIIIPQIKLSEKEWYNILAHEVSHYYHGDLWGKTIFELLYFVYWWNPFIYLLKKQISKALEIHIDLAVTKQMNQLERIEYLECLLKIVKTRTAQPIDNLALNFYSNNSSVLSQRFHLILEDNNINSKQKLKGLYLTMIPVLLLITLSFFTIFEPYAISYQDEYGTIELRNENSFLVCNPNGGYDVYFEGSYFATVQEIKDSYSDLPIYKNIKEAKRNEKNQ